MRVPFFVEFGSSQRTGLSVFRALWAMDSRNTEFVLSSEGKIWIMELNLFDWPAWLDQRLYYRDCIC